MKRTPKIEESYQRLKNSILRSHMRFDKQELIDILRALEMQYNDGPDDYDHAIRLQRLINVIKSFLKTL